MARAHYMKNEQSLINLFVKGVAVFFLLALNVYYKFSSNIIKHSRKPFVSSN